MAKLVSRLNNESFRFGARRTREIFRLRQPPLKMTEDSTTLGVRFAQTTEVTQRR